MLLAEVPVQWKAELRLGLQEALVNAAKHGNALDPTKTVVVRFSVVENDYWWIISDQGSGFAPPSNEGETCRCVPGESGECGRGLYILHQIFDQVQWNSQGTELRLRKQVSTRQKAPLIC
ncbi:ATP-binding protein [Leptolyngbya sp. 'hensonii']|uniref:ATP-binding protein n=1 Tax=Leptolyngbya sp. 'hensonii' TaxID=1922337 RepID=UPI00342B5FAD